MNFRNQINNDMNKNLEKFFSKVEEMFKVDSNDLQRLWNGEYVNDDNKVNDVHKKDKSNRKKCPYEYIKGKNKGNICGNKSIKGKTYCYAHKKHEEKGQVLPKIVPVKKTKLKKTPTDRKIIKHKPTGKMYHKKSGLVFNEKNRVIGYLKNDKICEMNSDAMEKCNLYRFKYAKPLPLPKEKEDNRIIVKRLEMDQKFWEAKLNENIVQVRFGKIGSNGRLNTKTYETYSIACDKLQKIIKQKLKKGYQEVKQKPTVKEDSDSSDSSDSDSDEEVAKVEKESKKVKDSDSSDDVKVEVETEKVKEDSDSDSSDSDEDVNVEKETKKVKEDSDSDSSDSDEDVKKETEKVKEDSDSELDSSDEENIEKMDTTQKTVAKALGINSDSDSSSDSDSD